MIIYSVIIPVYRGEKTVRRCVESVLASGSEDIEIILVEDHGPDNSWQLCQQLSEQYTNVRCIRNESNRGVSYTRNRGVAAATGDYLLFADCDDWVDPGFIPSFRRAAESGALFAVSGYVTHDEMNSGSTLEYGWQDQDEFLTVGTKECLRQLYEGTLIHQVWNKIFRTELVRVHGIRFDESISIGEDTRFVLEYLKKTGIQEIMLINRKLYHYMRDQAGSLMFRVGYESVEEPLKNLRAIYELLDMPEAEIRKQLTEDRKRQMDIYAYMIMHNVGMPMREKRRLMLALDREHGKRRYYENLVLYCKEQIVKWLRKRQKVR